MHLFPQATPAQAPAAPRLFRPIGVGGHFNGLRNLPAAKSAQFDHAFCEGQRFARTNQYVTDFKEPAVLPPVILARDHLEQAVVILTGDDDNTVQLRSILVRTIALMNDVIRQPEPTADNVIDFALRRRGQQARR